MYCGHHHYDLLIKKIEVCKCRVGKALSFPINFLKVEIRGESVPVSCCKKKDGAFQRWNWHAPNWRTHSIIGTRRFACVRPILEPWLGGGIRFVSILTHFWSWVLGSRLLKSLVLACWSQGFLQRIISYHVSKLVFSFTSLFWGLFTHPRSLEDAHRIKWVRVGLI